jgi:hypothetical protein
LLQAGAKLAEREAIGLASSLYHDPDDVQARFKLIGFYIEKMYSESRVDPVLFDQLQWLMRRCPDLPLFSSVTGAYGVLDGDQFLSMYETLLDTFERHVLLELHKGMGTNRATIELPINAKIFLRYMDEYRESLLGVAKKAFAMSSAKAFFRRMYTEDPEPPTDPSRVPRHPLPTTGDTAKALPLPEPPPGASET